MIPILVLSMPIAIGTLAAGTALASRISCLVSRAAGGVCVAVACLSLATPAHAATDQNLVAADGAQVTCTASAKDLTRISLVGDEFAAVSKIKTGNPTDDFSVVSEAVRGDIYLSVPDGFNRATLSFFGTSKRGYVYKFLCRMAGNDAVQVFVTNPAIAKADQAEAAPQKVAATQEDQAVSLVQAMYANKSVDGYELTQHTLRPVYVGDLKVQMIAEYRGDAMTGRVLRIENKGTQTRTLTEATVAPPNTLAVSIADANLAPGKVTTAYLVSKSGN